MSEPDQKQLLRLLHGELASDDAAALEQRVRDDPEVARRYRRLESTWERMPRDRNLNLPDTFAGDVVEAARSETRARLASAWSGAPPAARWAGIAAAVAGLAVGSLLALTEPVRGPGPALEAPVSTLADGYLELLLEEDQG